MLVHLNDCKNRLFFRNIQISRNVDAEKRTYSLGRPFRSGDYSQSRLIMSAAFSPIIKAIEFVWPPGINGMIDASTTRRLPIPRTLNCGSTTASGSVSGPILHVPTWWWRLVVNCLTAHAQYASDPNGSCSQPGNGTDSSVEPNCWNAWVSLITIAYMKTNKF